jgi:hypothetical protein
MKELIMVAVTLIVLGFLARGIVAKFVYNDLRCIVADCRIVK